MRLIECRGCDAANCEGCNLLTLADMLRKGKLDCLMDEHRSIVIDPESLRAKGRWIEHEWAEEENGLLVSNFECSNCHIWESKTSDYCPNCGAKMEENK